MQPVIETDGLLRLFGTIGFRPLLIGPRRAIGGGDQVNHGGIALVMIPAARARELEELVLRPPVPAPKGQWVQTSPVAQDQPRPFAFR
jgi:hypothetical protein